MHKTYRQKSCVAKAAWTAKSKPDLFVNNLGIFESLGNFYFEQVSSCFSCHIIRDGTGIMRVNGRDYNALAGTLVVFFPGSHIIYYDFPEKPWKYTWFRLEGKKTLWALKQAGLREQNPVMAIPDFENFNKWLEKFSSEFMNGKYNSVFPVSSAWEFISLLLPDNESQENGQENSKNLADASRLLLEDPFSEIYTVEQLAEHFGVNRSTLFRAFRKSYGVSPKEYIKNFQFEKARELLSRSRLSIKEIAHICGFEKQDYFSVSFRRKYKMTPSEWRSGNVS